MTKAKAELSNKLSIFWLKQNNCISKPNGIKSGTITWSYGYSENKSSIGYTISTYENDEYINLNYTHTNNYSDEKIDLDYRIKLVTTPCNYGGKRYWFICPIEKDGVACNKRVGVLYLSGKYYCCRQCGEIGYTSQMQSERYKGFVSIPDVEKAGKEVKRYYYRGKRTKKYNKFIKLNKKLENNIIKSFASSDKRFSKLVDNEK